MSIKFAEATKAETQKERNKAINKAMSKVLDDIAAGTLKAPRRKGGRKPDPNAKQLLTLRLDPQVIEFFRSTGDGWQTRMNEVLRKSASL